MTKKHFMIYCKKCKGGTVRLRGKCMVCAEKKRLNDLQLKSLVEVVRELSAEATQG